jgi:hypothetical protein
VVDPGFHASSSIGRVPRAMRQISIAEIMGS